MAIAFRSSTNATTGNNAPAVSLVINKPAGTADGDLIQITILASTLGAVSSISGSSGWTAKQPCGVSGGGKNSTLTSYEKIASSEPSSWTINLNSSTNCCAVAEAFTGVADTGQYDVGNSAATGSLVSSLGITTITTAHDNEIIVHAGAYRNNGTYTEPSGFSLRDTASFVDAITATWTLKLSDFVQATAGATGTITCNFGTAVNLSLANMSAYMPPQSTLVVFPIFYFGTVGRR